MGMIHGGWQGLGQMHTYPGDGAAHPPVTDGITGG